MTDLISKAAVIDMLNDMVDNMNPAASMQNQKMSRMAIGSAIDRLKVMPVVEPDMSPPITHRDRWMFEQGRLAERDNRTKFMDSGKHP